MTFAILPIRPTKEQLTVRTDLLGAEYRFDVQWNRRDESWYLSMFTRVGEPIVQGCRIVISNPILNLDRSQIRPRGIIVAIDQENTDIDPGLNDLGNRVLLVFTDFQ